MDKKDIHVYSEFIGTDKEILADDINMVFPIDSKENIIKSIKILTSEDINKIYSKNEQIYMFNRLITKTKEFDNEFITSIKEILKGGNNVVDKVFTESEMKAKAEELSQAKIQTKEQNEKLKTMDEQLANLQKQIEVLTASAEFEKSEKEKIANEKNELEQKMKAIEEDGKKIVLAQKRLEHFAEYDFYDFGEARDWIFSYLKNATDEDFEGFKKCIEIVIKEKGAKANEAKIEEEKEKEREKAEAAKKGLVENSEQAPNIIEENEQFKALAEAMASYK